MVYYYIESTPTVAWILFYRVMENWGNFENGIDTLQFSFYDVRTECSMLNESFPIKKINLQAQISKVRRKWCVQCSSGLKAINHHLTTKKIYYRLNTKGHTHTHTHIMTKRTKSVTTLTMFLNMIQKSIFDREREFQWWPANVAFISFDFPFILLFDHIDNSFVVFFCCLHLFYFVPFECFEYSLTFWCEKLPYFGMKLSKHLKIESHHPNNVQTNKRKMWCCCCCCYCCFDFHILKDISFSLCSHSASLSISIFRYFLYIYGWFCNHIGKRMCLYNKILKTRKQWTGSTDKLNRKKRSKREKKQTKWICWTHIPLFK